MFMTRYDAKKDRVGVGTAMKLDIYFVITAEGLIFIPAWTSGTGS